jgi:hypothetical protein
MFAMTSCGKNEQKMRSLNLRETSRFLLFRKASVQQYVPDVMISMLLTRKVPKHVLYYFGTGMSEPFEDEHEQ